MHLCVESLWNFAVYRIMHAGCMARAASLYHLYRAFCWSFLMASLLFSAPASRAANSAVASSTACSG